MIEHGLFGLWDGERPGFPRFGALSADSADSPLICCLALFFSLLRRDDDESYSIRSYIDYNVFMHAIHGMCSPVVRGSARILALTSSHLRCRTMMIKLAALVLAAAPTVFSQNTPWTPSGNCAAGEVQCSGCTCRLSLSSLFSPLSSLPAPRRRVRLARSPAIPLVAHHRGPQQHAVVLPGLVPGDWQL